MKIEGKNILMISPEAWGTNMLSKHHYAAYLAKANKVYFLNPVEGSKVNPFGSVDAEINHIKENLLAISYRNLVPKMDKLPKAAQRKVFKRQAKQLLEAIKEPIDLVWSFDPFRFWDLSVFGIENTLYHTVDFHPTARFEKEIVLSAKNLIAVTDLVCEDLLTYRKDVSIVSHGADIEGFQHQSTFDIPGEATHKACYVGNFHKNIDYEILEQLATENPSVDFLMIGPTLDSNLSQNGNLSHEVLKQLKELTNIYFLGSKPHQELMGILSHSAINLVLFKKEHEKTHCSPHKLMGYFYSGAITLSNFIDAHKSTDKDIIHMEQDLKAIPKTFKDILSEIEVINSEAMRKKRRDFAEANSYEQKIEEIGAHLFG